MLIVKIINKIRIKEEEYLKLKRSFEHGYLGITVIHIQKGIIDNIFVKYTSTIIKLVNYCKMNDKIVLFLAIKFP